MNTFQVTVIWISQTLNGCFISAVPPSKPYFIMDVKTPWVAGKKYRIECVAPDAKPDADICLYKGENIFRLVYMTITVGGNKHCGHFKIFYI